MTRRAVLVLATVAALLGAPPTAFATSNTLHSPVVSPSSGAIGTTFQLRVTYEGRFPASAVVATVGTASLSMSRVSGTGEAGTWEVSATALPVGTWPITFVAVVVRGNAPVLAGGDLIVVGDATPVHTPTPAPTAQRPSGQKPTAGNPTTAPAPDPRPGDASPADPASPPSDPAATVEPTHTTATRAGGAGGDGGDGGAGGDDRRGSDREPAQQRPDRRSTRADTAPSSGSPDPSARSPWGGIVASPSAATPAGRSEATPSTDGELSGGTWPIAFWTAALTGVIGIVFLVVGRRRRPAADAAGAAALAEDTATLLRRRALRRARTVIDSDPIVSSMGIDEAALAARGSERRRRRPGQS